MGAAYLLEGAETARLLFRKLTPADYDQWLPFHQDPLSSAHWSGEHSDPEIACKIWFEFTFHRYAHHLGGMNLLIEKKTNSIIGQCGLLVQTVDGVQELEIGYSVLPHYWKQGYATEAATKCMAYAYENELTTSLISIIHVNNTPSQKVAKKLGMHIDKTTVYKANPVYIFRHTMATIATNTCY